MIWVIFLHFYNYIRLNIWFYYYIGIWLFFNHNYFRLDELIDTFNDEGISNYLVAFMRLLTSKQMKKEAEIYINYIDEQVDVNEFCALEVEPMFKESDFVHIHALSKVIFHSINRSLSHVCTMHSLHWSGVISRVEKAKYTRRFVLWKSSEYKKMAINFVLEGMERLYLEICVYIFKKKVHIVFLDKVS